MEGSPENRGEASRSLSSCLPYPGSLFQGHTGSFWVCHIGVGWVFLSLRRPVRNKRKIRLFIFSLLGDFWAPVLDVTLRVQSVDPVPG